MSEDRIEKLLREAASWEPTATEPSGLAHAALTRRKRRPVMAPALAGAAFAFGFCAMAVLNRINTPGPTASTNIAEWHPSVSATPLPGEPLNPGGTGLRLANANGSSTYDPNRRPGSVVGENVKPSTNIKPTPEPTRGLRKKTRYRGNPLTLTNKVAAGSKSRYVPIDEPTRIPGLIAQPSEDGGTVKLIPATVTLDDSDVILANYDSNSRNYNE